MKFRIKQNNQSNYDSYSFAFSIFLVWNFSIKVSDKKPGTALRKLSEKQRSYILSCCFQDMRDREIAELYHVSRSSASCTRNRELQKPQALMNERKQRNGKRLGYPAYEKIVKASSSNKQAIKEILRFYDGYISKLCLRPFYHENGKISMRIDEELKGKVQTELMNAMLRFQFKMKQDCNMRKGRYTFLCNLPCSFVVISRLI